MKKKYEIQFDRYTNKFDMSNEEIHFKYLHSYRVEELMKKLSDRLYLNEENKELAAIIGLLHDIGRFEQIKKYGTSSDTKTGVDHAAQSCIYLFDENHIRDFIDDDSHDQIIRDAIMNHNKFKIDSNLQGPSQFLTHMIRDMDKVDIYRVIVENFNIEFNWREVSKTVDGCFLNHQQVLNADRKTKSDNVIANLSFIYDIKFKESLEILEETGYLDDYFRSIHYTEDSKYKVLSLRQEIDSYIKGRKKEYERIG